jgi:hypothetical protein
MVNELLNFADWWELRKTEPNYITLTSCKMGGAHQLGGLSHLILGEEYQLMGGTWLIYKYENEERPDRPAVMMFGLCFPSPSQVTAALHDDNWLERIRAYILTQAKPAGASAHGGIAAAGVVATELQRTRDALEDERAETLTDEELWSQVDTLGSFVYSTHESNWYAGTWGEVATAFVVFAERMKEE